VLIRRILHEWRVSTWLGSTVFPRAQHRGFFPGTPRDIPTRYKYSWLRLCLAYFSPCLFGATVSQIAAQPRTTSRKGNWQREVAWDQVSERDSRDTRLRFHSSSSCSSSSYRIMHFIQCVSSSVMLISNFRTKVLEVQAWSCLASYFLRFLQTGYRPSRLHGLS